MVEFAAFVYAGASLLVVVFQFCLALGAPWGAYAMAGKFPGRFPPAMRVAAVVQATLLTLMVPIVLTAANIKLPDALRFSDKLIWGVLAFAGLGVIANSATPSSKERRLWLPVTVILLATSLTVAVASKGG
jgi:hypothetical protein